MNSPIHKVCVCVFLGVVISFSVREAPVSYVCICLVDVS